MKSSVHGRNESISVENITPFGVWLSDGKTEYAIPFSEFPCLKKAPVEALMNPVLYHGFHLCWESLDVDIDLRSLHHLKDFPLYFETDEPALHAIAEESGCYNVQRAASPKHTSLTAAESPREYTPRKRKK